MATLKQKGGLKLHVVLHKQSDQTNSIVGKSEIHTSKKKRMKLLLLSLPCVDWLTDTRQLLIYNSKLTWKREVKGLSCTRNIDFFNNGLLAEMAGVFQALCFQVSSFTW
jgi:hypothetical protein